MDFFLLMILVLFENLILNKCLFYVKVVDCRICGDPNSVLRFAFIEFTDEGNVNLVRYTLKEFLAC